MLLAALVYWFLAMRIRIHAGVYLCGRTGSFFVQAEAWGMSLRTDGEFLCGEGSLQPVLRRRYTSGHAARKRSAVLPKCLRWLLHAGTTECFSAYVRIGLGDACVTALAAGGIRAAGTALLACVGLPRTLQVVPDYQNACFCLTAEGILAVSPGDIVFAAIKNRSRKKKEEGFKWKDIPLRA